MLKAISAGIPDYSRDNDALVWERRLLACSSRQLAANLITKNKLCSLPAVGAATSTGWQPVLPETRNSPARCFRAAPSRTGRSTEPLSLHRSVARGHSRSGTVRLLHR